MGRTKGTYTLTSNIEPKVGAPLDARTIVKLLVDLTANNTFEYPYKGMKVFVEENNKSYTLIGSDPTVSTNWIEDNSGVQSDWDEDDTTELSYIQNKPNLGTAAFKDVPASGDAGFTQVVLGKDTRLTYYDRNRYDASVKCSTNIVEGNIIVGLNGLYHHLNDGTVFDITYPILYAKNNMAAGAANKSNYDSLAIDITITQQMTLTQFLPVYIKGRLSGNLFNPISTTPLTQEMLQDGYHYMLLGLAGTTTNMYLFHDHRIFANNGGSFCEIIGNLGTAAYKDIPLSGNASIYQVVTGNDTRLSDARPASDVSAWAKESTKPTYTASEVGAIASTLKGSVNGVAELDAAGKVPSSQLPSFVDDVIEVADYDHLPITGESGKIYVTLDTNKTYRWTGSGYAEISESLALGETSSTAYRGDRGKTAYDHSQDSGRITTAVSSGLYKFSATAQGHISGTTEVQKSDITALGIPAQDTTYEVVSKTANGLAPQLPNETTTTKYLRQDGSWQVPPDTWRGIQNSLSSDSTTDSLSAAQGKALATGSARDNTKVAKAGDTMSGTLRLDTAASSSYGEGLRINKNAANGASTLTIGTDNGTSTGMNDGGWWIGTLHSSKPRQLFITHNGSTGGQTYFYATASNDQNASLQLGGILKIGGNSGPTMQYNSTTQSIDFIFI